MKMTRFGMTHTHIVRKGTRKVNLKTSARGLPVAPQR